MTSSDEVSRPSQIALVAAVGSMLAVVPGAIRAGSAGVSVAVGWLALAGLCAALVGPVALSLHSARRHASGLWTIATAALLSSGVLMAFAALLKAKTHHRPLGAVVFSIAGAIVLLAATAKVARIVHWWRSSDDEAVRKRGKLMLLLGGAVGVLLLLKFGLPLVSTAAYRGAALDGVLMLAVVGAAVRTSVPAAVSRFGLPLLLALGLTGVAVVAFSATVRQGVFQIAPVPSALLSWLG